MYFSMEAHYRFSLTGNLTLKFQYLRIKSSVVVSLDIPKKKITPVLVDNIFCFTSFMSIHIKLMIP